MSYLVKSKYVTTRKAHLCFGCGRKIPGNTEMLCETVKDDTLFDLYICKTCQKVMADILVPGEDFGEGDLYNDAIYLEATE